MFDFFKKKDAIPQIQLPELFGLRLGGSFELNHVRMQFIEEHLIIDHAAELQIIQAVGVVHLDAHSQIVRYYTDDDGFIQFVLEGGSTEDCVNDGKLWYFYDTLGISSESEWEHQLQSGISRPNYELEGKTFSRLWEDVGGNARPVAMTEVTYTKGEEPSETDQFIMVYHRQAHQNLEEYLMISGEEIIVDNERADRSLVISTGLDLSTADFTVIS
ncbi:MAG: YjfK family protein [Gammaproteobacteria bacterium]